LASTNATGDIVHRRRRFDQLVVDALVIPLTVMFNELGDRSTEIANAQRNDPIEALVLGHSSGPDALASTKRQCSRGTVCALHQRRLTGRELPRSIRIAITEQHAMPCQRAFVRRDEGAADLVRD
jgi:hypothetical protein